MAERAASCHTRYVITISCIATIGGVWGPVALISAHAYVVLFNFSWGPVMWVRTYGFCFPGALRSVFFVISMVHETNGIELEHMVG